MTYRVSYKTLTGRIESATFEADSPSKAAKRLRDWKGNRIRILGIAPQ